MKLIKAIFGVIQFFVYLVGLFGVFLYGIYDVWYFTIIFLGILVFISFRFKNLIVSLLSLGIIISNYISYSFFKSAPIVDGGFQGLDLNVNHTIMSGWFVLLTLILIIILIFKIKQISDKGKEVEVK